MANLAELEPGDLALVTQFLHQVKPSTIGKTVVGLGIAKPDDRSFTIYMSGDETVFLSMDYFISHPFWKN